MDGKRIRYTMRCFIKQTLSYVYNSLDYDNNGKAVYYFVPNACDKLNLMEYVLYFCF